jgi:hypothetical protein
MPKYQKLRHPTGPVPVSSKRRIYEEMREIYTEWGDLQGKSAIADDQLEAIAA